jgi:hypothetical protein
VSTTAVGVAAVRAAEAARPVPLFVDPLAPVFVRAAQTFWTVDRDEPADRRRVGALIFWIRVRTRFLDDVIARASADGCRQFVVLGAGLDARAFRLPLPPDARFFEVDLPGVLEFKERVVRDNNFTPACERIVVPTDLAGDWTEDLDRAGFDPAPRTWLAEGLLRTHRRTRSRDRRHPAVGARESLRPRSAQSLAGTPVTNALPSPGRLRGAVAVGSPPDAHVWLGDGLVGRAVRRGRAGAAYGLEVPRRPPGAPVTAPGWWTRRDTDAASRSGLAAGIARRVAYVAEQAIERSVAPTREPRHLASERAVRVALGGIEGAQVLFDGREVAAADGTGERAGRAHAERVGNRRAHQRGERLERHAGRPGEPLDLAEQRDEMVRSHDRGRAEGRSPSGSANGRIPSAAQFLGLRAACDRGPRLPARRRPSSPTEGLQRVERPDAYVGAELAERAERLEPHRSGEVQNGAPG